MQARLSSGIWRGASWRRGVLLHWGRVKEYWNREGEVEPPHSAGPTFCIAKYNRESLRSTLSTQDYGLSHAMTSFLYANILIFRLFHDNKYMI